MTREGSSIPPTPATPSHTHTPSQSESQHSEDGASAKRCKGKRRQRHHKGDKLTDGNTPDAGKSGSPSKGRRFMSVKQMMEQGSLVAKQLFGGQGSEGSEVNMNRFMQRTGKVGSC